MLRPGFTPGIFTLRDRAAKQKRPSIVTTVTGTEGTAATVMVHAYITAGGENRDDEERLYGMGRVDRLADPIGMGVPGCDGRISAPSSRASHSGSRVRPTPSALCWYWADPFGETGYWDYCS
jgi:hypothetical protein